MANRLSGAQWLRCWLLKVILRLSLSLLLLLVEAILLLLLLLLLLVLCTRLLELRLLCRPCVTHLTT